MRKKILCRKYFPVYVRYLEIISFRFISTSLGSIRFKASVRLLVFDFKANSFGIFVNVHLIYMLKKR